MQWIKNITNNYKKEYDSNYYFKREKIFEINNNKLIAFLPKHFKYFSYVEFQNEIASLPFNWEKNIPQFRFKAIIRSKPSQYFLKKYEKYLLSLNYKKNQIKFHIYPNALLKAWKEEPKIYDTSSKKEINYREDYFMQSTKNNNYLFFFECFSIPIDNEISEINKKNIKKIKYLTYYDRLFLSRQQTLFGITKLDTNHKFIDEKIDDYKSLKNSRLVWLQNANDAIKKISYEEGIFNDFKGAFILPLKINLPLTNIHYIKFWLDDTIFGCFLIAPNKLMVLFDNFLFKKNEEEIVPKIVWKYVEECIWDSRNRWILFNKNTDAEIMNQIKKLVYDNPKLIAIERTKK